MTFWTLPNLRRVVGVPACGHDHGPDLHVHGLGFHVQVDRVVLAGLGTLVARRAFADLAVDDVLERERLVVRKVGGLGLAHAEVEVVRPLDLAGLRAHVAPRALVVHEAGLRLDGHIEVALGAGYLFHLSHGIDRHVTIVFDALVLDLQTAVRGTELPEVLVQLRHAAAEIGVLFHDDHIGTRLRGFYCRREAGKAAADNQNLIFRHGIPFLLKNSAH